MDTMKAKVRKSACSCAATISDPAIVKATLTLGVVTAFTQLHSYTNYKTPAVGAFVDYTKQTLSKLYFQFLSAFCKSLVEFHQGT